ncbi:MAG: F0F1 ATP synthase subunit B [candidate division Zixibacteria bacterium]|nr:F0F1 ATP synthase subunit B [candidate division Zixibacteria bacterium]
MFDQIFEALKIEIPQIITHAVGFLIALWVLKKFAWGPLLGLLEERRERIKNSFDEIDQKQQEADNLNEEYQAKLRDIDNESRKRLTAAVSEGEKIAARIKEDGRTEAKGMIVKARAELDRDVAKARVALKEDMVAMALTATEKIILEKLDDDKHRRLIGDFIDDLEAQKQV